MIDAQVLDVKPHPDQATNNPGCWAVQLCVSHRGEVRTFWRWFNVREMRNDIVVVPSSRKPSNDEILAQFWNDMFSNLHGFDFEAPSLDISQVVDLFEISDETLFRERASARPRLIDLLVEVDRQVRQHFKVRQLRLALDGSRIAVCIETSQNAEQASKSYDDLHKKWWRANVTAEDRLTIAIDFV